MTDAGQKDIEFAYVNDLVGDYDESEFDVRMRGWMMRAMEPWMPATGTCLQMGCYKGDLTVLLEERFGRVDVVDAAERFLQVTRSRLKNPGTFHQTLFEDFVTDKRYDAVFLVHVLEHVVDSVETLAGIGRLLSPGGRAFVVVPNGHAASRRIAVAMGLIDHCTALTPSDVKHGHRRTYVLDTLESDARKAGLTVAHRGGIFFKPLANFQFDTLFGSEVMSDAYLEGCFQLGFTYPDLTASVFVVLERR
ncbi:class I SAM-dependent methyltransferase [Thalassobaculum salexigens]|uniref:class I SAM-dependent methyltransferase n=1 Tax=Thalassobaculum salexigens TaxID=455360 RepID=UPI0003F82DC6|nr:class I SAM-dependent methyltransferase [Thalassobaculum salexigens]